MDEPIEVLNPRDIPQSILNSNFQYDEYTQQKLQELRGSIDTIIGAETNVLVLVEIDNNKHHFRIGKGDKRKRLLIIKLKMCYHFQDSFAVPNIIWGHKEKIVYFIGSAIVVVAMRRYVGQEHLKDILDLVLDLAKEVMMK